VPQWQHSAAGGSAPAVQPSASVPRRGAIGMAAAVMRCAVPMATGGVEAVDTAWSLRWQQHQRTSGPIAVCVSSSVHLAQRMRLLTFAAHVESAAAAAAAAPLFPGVARAHSRCGRRGGRIRRRAKDQRLAGRVQVGRGQPQARRRHARVVGTNASTPLHACGTSKRNNVGQDWRQQCMMVPRCAQRSFHQRALLVALCHAVAAICAHASAPVC